MDQDFEINQAYELGIILLDITSANKRAELLKNSGVLKVKGRHYVQMHILDRTEKIINDLTNLFAREDASVEDAKALQGDALNPAKAFQFKVVTYGFLELDFNDRDIIQKHIEELNAKRKEREAIEKQQNQTNQHG